MDPLATLPSDWYPETTTALRLAREYGKEVDLRLILEKFRAYHSEGQTSRNWDARFVVWVIRDVQQVRERHKGGTDDLGMPLTQNGSARPGLTPGDEGYVSIDDLAEEARRLAEDQWDAPDPDDPPATKDDDPMWGREQP